MDFYVVFSFMNPVRTIGIAACRAGLLLSSLLGSASGIALELSGSVSTDAEYTSNARTSSTNREEEVVHRAGINFGVLEERKRVRADANVSIEHEVYYNNTFDDETSLRSGFGLFSVDLVEDFFNWQATFTRTDVLTDSSQELNPDTREYRNIFRTGPTISYAISRTMNLQMAANYVMVDNSGESAIDSERANGNARLNYQYNSLTSLFANVRHEETIESDDNEEINNTNWSLGFARQLTGGEFLFSYGFQTVSSNREIADDSDETDSNYFDITFTREGLFGQNVQLSYLEEVSDTSVGFSVDEQSATSLAGRVSAVASTDIEKRRRATFGLNRDFDPFAYDLRTIYQESELERSQTIERYRSLVFGIQPKLYSRLVPRFEYRYVRENFREGSSGEDVSRRYLVSMSYETVPELFLRANIGFEKVDNDENSSRESEEFTGGIGIRWDFL